MGVILQLCNGQSCETSDILKINNIQFEGSKNFGYFKAEISAV
jgi:hypothetical protein